MTQWPLAVLFSVVSFDSRSLAGFPFALLYSELHASDPGQALVAQVLISSIAGHRWP